MANGDLLRRLFKAYASQDDAAIKSTAFQIIEIERAKNHRLLADDLERILLIGNGRTPVSHLPKIELEVPKDRERGLPLVEVSRPREGWERLVLRPRWLRILQRLIREYADRELLATRGVEPRRRILFYGPPGCGKTITARVLAGVLSLPLVTVRFDAIVSSYLGETAANLRSIFDFAETGQWVLLFDEFDALAKDRDNALEHGELKRVVNSLLQMMDGSTSDSLLIAATNHDGLLDSAVWRRFDTVIPFEPPTLQDRTLLFRHFLGGFDTSAVDTKNLARRLPGATGSDIERICLAAVRSAIIDRRDTILSADFDDALADHSRRARQAR